MKGSQLGNIARNIFFLFAVQFSVIKAGANLNEPAAVKMVVSFALTMFVQVLGPVTLFSLHCVKYNALDFSIVTMLISIIVHALYAVSS